MERVGDDVAFGLENVAWPLDAMRARVPEALASVGLAGFEERRSTRLSGGEQQRVALAGRPRAAPRRPRPRRADGAPRPGRHGGDLRRSSPGCASGRAATIVLIEHRAELAWPLADVVLALDDDGRPIDVGPPAAVLEALRASAWPRPASGCRRTPPERPRPAAGHGPSVGARDGARSSRCAASGSATTARTTVLRDVDLTRRPRANGSRWSGRTAAARARCSASRSASVDRRRVSSGSASATRRGRRPSSSRASPATSSRSRSSGSSRDTVREEVELGLEPEQVGYAHALCDHLRLPLETFGERSPYRLSGGEQRRLSLVTGLARRPLLLALDEPTFGQDRRGHEALVSALDQLVEEGSALLAATHDERFVRDATDRRVELAAGWIVEDGAGGRRPARCRRCAGEPRMSAAFMPPELETEQRESVLGRTNPLVKLGIALAWLLGLGLTLDVRPPLILTFVAIFAGLQLGSIPQDALARRLAPLALAALGIALANLLFSTHNPDPLARELLRLGPLRITVEAVEAAAGVGARVASIVSVGAVFALTTDVTRLIDSLVQLGRVSPRFAYGALAAYQAVPRLADDLGTLRERAPAARAPGVASAPPRRAARARDPPRRPAGDRDGRARLRRRPADRSTGRSNGPSSTRSSAASALAILVVALLIAG